MPKLLIFDFDGTIVNSKAVYYNVMNKYLSDYGFNRKEIDEAIDVGLSVAETLKKLGFSPVFRWFLKKKIMRDVLLKVNEIKKCKDVDLIRGVKARKILISNSYSEFVISVLKHLKLRNEFDEIYGGENFKDKTEFIKKYLKKNMIGKKDVYYVGDRVSDVLVARKVGCKSIIVAGKCAWDSRKEILKEKPDFVVDDIKNIKKIMFI